MSTDAATIMDAACRAARLLIMMKLKVAVRKNFACFNVSSWPSRIAHTCYTKR